MRATLIIILLAAATAAAAQFAPVPEPQMPEPHISALAAPAEPRYPNPPYEGPVQLAALPAAPGYPEPPRRTWRHRGAVVFEPMAGAHPQMLMMVATGEPQVPRHSVWRRVEPSIEPAPPP